MVQERTTNEARQGETSKGNRVFTVLASSLALAVVLAVAAYFWLLATPAEEARDNIPQAQSPATADGGQLPPEGGPGGG